MIESAQIQMDPSHLSMKGCQRVEIYIYIYINTSCMDIKNIKQYYALFVIT